MLSTNQNSNNTMGSMRYFPINPTGNMHNMKYHKEMSSALKDYQDEKARVKTFKRRKPRKSRKSRK